MITSLNSVKQAVEMICGLLKNNFNISFLIILHVFHIITYLSDFTHHSRYLLPCFEVCFAVFDIGLAMKGTKFEADLDNCPPIRGYFKECPSRPNHIPIQNGGMAGI